MPTAKRITDLTAYTQALGTDWLVIVDITTNTTKKILVSDFIKSGGGVIKVTKGFADFTGAGATKSISITSIPAGGIVTGAKMKHSAAFSGGTTATATAQLKDDNATTYGAAFNVFQAPGNTKGEVFSGMNGSAGLIPDHSIATNLNCLLTLTGDITSNLTAGSIDFWIEVKIYKS